MGVYTTDSTEAVYHSYYFTDPFKIASNPELSHVYLLDKDGDYILDSSNNKVDVLDATPSAPVGTDAAGIEVWVNAQALSYTSDPDTSASKVELITYSSTTAATATFEHKTGDDYVATIDRFDGYAMQGFYDGIYAVRVVASDQLGNQLTDSDGNKFVLVAGTLELNDDGSTVTLDPTPDGSLVIDSHSPSIVTDYPHDEAVSTYYTPEETAESAARTFDVPEKIDFFNHVIEFGVYFSDLHLDEANSTLFGVPLSQILADPENAIPDVPCTVTTSTSTFGVPEIRITAHCHDGVYAIDQFATAQDTISGHDPEIRDSIGFDTQDLDITHFIVDLDAPQITAAEIGFPPPELGNDADGGVIVNGADNNGNRVWIVYAERGADPTSVALTVDEPHGIRSVEIIDPSEAYVDWFGGFNAVVESGNQGLTETGHTGVYDLTVLSHLVDGLDFSDDVQFVITDFAGNQYFWSMAEEGTERTVPGSSDFEDFATTNTDLAYEDSGGSLVDMLHPTLLVPDDTSPILTVTGPEDLTNPVAVGYERYYDEGQSLALTLTELNVKYLVGFSGGDALYDPNGFVTGDFAGLDPNRVVLTYTFTAGEDGATPETRYVRVKDLIGDASNPALYTWSTNLTQDGDYVVAPAEFIDVALNKSGTSTVEAFTIDTTAPVLTVTYDNDSSSKGTFYDAQRTATITVVEHNFDPDLFTITVEGDHGAQGMVVPTPSGWTDSGDTHTCTVTFAEDGNFRLMVAGQDKAGNTADPYDSEIFVIDSEAPVIAQYYAYGEAPASTFDTDDPVVELPEPTGTYDDGSGTIYFYTHAISVDAKVQDRNFDSKDTTISLTKDGTETALDNSWTRDPDELGANSYELWTTSVAYTEDGEYLAPHVLAGDLALNETDNQADAEAVRIVLDLNPPTVKVDVDRSPSTQGSTGSDPVNFYNAATTMTITVSDEHNLRSVEVSDPDGLYTITSSEASAEGQGQVVLTVALKDGSGSQDGEFDRPITVTAEDLAGNTRTWTIDHQGEVTVDKVSSAAENAGINGGSVYPVALVQDTIAPVVSLSGATAGAYYNTPQTVTATVTEYCMNYLQLFDGGRGIVTVTMRPGSSSGSTMTYTIPASAFTGTRPTYTDVIDCSGDGHYSLTAQFRDYAGNLSNQVSIGEFTIDQTPPMISLEFDNNEARNGNYYKDTRTATITVTEHNFDPSLISIETTGEIGGWVSSGDTHTCTVFFGEGSNHTLKVNGSDLAGNEAMEVSEPEFVVDLTAPEITISGIAQRLGYLTDDASEGLVNAYYGDLEDLNAYNGVVVPVITYSDNEVLSSRDLTFSIVGSKNGEDVAYQAYMSDEAKEMTTTFRDLGYIGPGEGDGSNWNDFYVDDYEAGADDIYTISASMTDQAGNEAEAEIVFSVNRYGSNYIVTLLGLDAEEEAVYEESGVLSEPPTIVVHEISVSGVDYLDEDGNLVTDNHHVQKEFANVTSPIRQSSGTGSGFGLVTIENKDQEVGWSEYIYTIRSANFGEGSDSDNNDNGQGLYRVNVMSDDLSSNANSTAAYWSSDSARQQVQATGSTTEFVLDEMAPVIDDLDLPEHLSAGEIYEASFHVSDDITSGNTVQVFVDGEELAATEVHGPSGGVGTYTFDIPGRAFNWSRDVRIVVTDYAGRTVEAGNGAWFWQSSFIPEGLAGAGVLAVATAGVVALRRRRAAQEPATI